MSYAVLIDHEISELAATELVAELAAELAASFTLVKLWLAKELSPEHE